MDLRQLDTLIAVAETGSFAAAAARVNLTASAVSQQIQALEAELGAHLFDRRTRPPRLNAGGEEMLRTARRIVQEMAETRLAISGGSTAGVLRIGAIRTVSMQLAPRALAGLRPRYPDLAFALTVGVSETLIADVAAHRLDAALVAEHVGLPAGLSWTEMLSEPLVLIAPRGTHDGSDAEMLRRLPFIRYRTAVPLARQIETELARLGVAPREVAVVNTMPAVVGCVAAGMGCAVVPKLALMDAAEDRFVARPFGEGRITRRLGLVERQVSSRARVLEAFRAELGRCVEAAGLDRPSAALPVDTRPGAQSGR